MKMLNFSVSVSDSRLPPMSSLMSCNPMEVSLGVAPLVISRSISSAPSSVMKLSCSFSCCSTVFFSSMSARLSAPGSPTAFMDMSRSFSFELVFSVMASQMCLMPSSPMRLFRSSSLSIAQPSLLRARWRSSQPTSVTLLVPRSRFLSRQSGFATMASEMYFAPSSARSLMPSARVCRELFSLRASPRLRPPRRPMRLSRRRRLRMVFELRR
mmetsp:Transcript_24008/g.71445  ORF Transcript_24008/g.71445 Transcript_24008/m.71445 type:complete len:212 (-) Transcript_24008:394-1029(-)